MTNGDVLAPAGLAGEPIDGLPDDVEKAYLEARKCGAHAAYTACEMMCRKILMHVAVDKKADENKTFAFYVNYLVTEGFITPPMKPWVDQIRNNANESTHEIPTPDQKRALGTLAFTTQLLKLVYEMDHKVRTIMGPPVPSSPTAAP